MNVDDGDTCRVFWGASGCDLPRGHDMDQQIRTHRQFEPSRHAVTVRDAFLFGEDLTPEELRVRIEEHGQ